MGISFCDRCGRLGSIHPTGKSSHNISPRMVDSVRVIHSGYGCDTGCCGHAIAIKDIHGIEVTARDSFRFSHPWIDNEDLHKWIQDFIEDSDFRGLPIDYEHSEVLDD